MDVFKDRLKELRLEQGLSRSELARRTGLDSTTIVKYELGQRKPSIECLILLAKYFGCSIDFLVGLEEY